MDLLEFIIYQQLNYPTECGILFFTLLGSLFWLGVIMILHGFPTQKIFYSKTEAPSIPRYFITGTLKDEMKQREMVQKRLDKGITNVITFVKLNPLFTLVVMLITLAGVMIL